MSQRVYNFNPGPAALPLPVLEEIQAEFLNYKGSGMSITEISHRSPLFEEVITDAGERFQKLLNLPEDYKVLFLQGGASLQFSMVPMNLLRPGRRADYVNTGTWSTKAIKEAQILGNKVNVVASSEDRQFTYIPANISFNEDADYVHITSNNTIRGTQWQEFPDCGDVPLIADMSSDIMGRTFDVRPFGLIYAGAQKNLGPAGVTVVILRQDLLERVPDSLPSMLKYTTYVEKNSLYNTPPCFAIYAVQLVLKWIDETIGGLAEMEELNRKKAKILYDCIDGSEFYRGTAAAESRSFMNVTFRLAEESLEATFVSEALENGLAGLKGHRSVGGCRASIYNATSVAAVEALVSFMTDFERRYG
ncbi:MAG: 3-phosphoserine/phosphohydroxythreonine transaminase [Deltaproteobacteria bacterium]|nr:3-phosphoserine/phosphohydroxythreonine transaminase [Deltaproteobacteria bacterium]MBW2072647.1 3-phosphoserine/phosphohydroxythreonine transaminase [Deltaproteobacteria bacterium]